MIEQTSSDEQIRLGSKYGNFAKRPEDEKILGKLSAGHAKNPPIDASEVNKDSDTSKMKELTPNDRSNAPYKRHDGERTS